MNCMSTKPSQAVCKNVILSVYVNTTDKSSDETIFDSSQHRIARLQNIKLKTSISSFSFSVIIAVGSEGKDTEEMPFGTSCKFGLCSLSCKANDYADEWVRISL
ncbi:hypothetical protein MAR_032210 [Mya arenaria]|uniref:Uncharacterized protein n=1 Tax=Mya arenaria TaxID=6604 RepID=A0ABY7F9Z4_MYAAR|nr:hypothetical protein MAR_032210 [Mya arenaria]